MRDHPTRSLQSSDREKSVNKRQQHKGTRAVLGNVGGRSAEREGGEKGTVRGLVKNRDESGQEQPEQKGQAKGLDCYPIAE